MPHFTRLNCLTAGLLLGFAAGSGGAQAPLSKQPMARPTAPDPAAPQTEPFAAEGRLALKPTHKTLEVATMNEVPIELHGSQPTVLVASWFDPKAGLPIGKEMPLTLLHHPDGTAYVNVVPTRSGQLQLSIVAIFADGGVDSQEIDVQSRLSDRTPKKLVVNRGVGNDARNEGTIYMDLKPTGRVALYASAVYDDFARPVPIPAQNVTFRIETAPGETAPIQVDAATGKLKALHLGAALVDATFAGVTRQTCVVVRHAREGGVASGCEGLQMRNDAVMQHEPIARTEPMVLRQPQASAPASPK